MQPRCCFGKQGRASRLYYHSNQSEKGMQPLCFPGNMLMIAMYVWFASILLLFPLAFKSHSFDTGNFNNRSCLLDQMIKYRGLTYWLRFCNCKYNQVCIVWVLCVHLSNCKKKRFPFAIGIGLPLMGLSHFRHGFCLPNHLL